MFKNNLSKILFIIGFFALGFLMLPQFNKATDKENEKKPSFYDTEINTVINEGLETGYLFDVNHKTYKPGAYHYVIETNANDERVRFLREENTSYSNHEIMFSWRQTAPPYRVIKKAKADTLYIIKKGRKIAFPKYFLNNK
ncbi:hypothetical protein [Chryseobacterium sp. PMSZPI]|uniref:hypothetical protein n=1 Tax=Chryseobacterium sp. PMSZPI TaxID=1033900 RepID=UPI000C33647E|nr:hypothetical protein [Chryseobacterium sp. PMSZPI]PKF75379.1 hypothetical protein CW752_04425 [Chryseobacterium sp. PMSZPI]